MHFYAKYYESRTVFDEKAMLSRLPLDMRTEVVRHNYRNEVTGPLFKNLLANEINRCALLPLPLHPCIIKRYDSTLDVLDNPLVP